MLSRVYAAGLLHEVTCEHFEDMDGRSSMKLDLACGGHTWVERDLPWQHEDEVVTCLWCIVKSNAWVVSSKRNYKVTF